METPMHQAQPIFSPMDIPVSGHRVHARVGGEGPPLVLLHSLLADDSSFDPIAVPLARKHQVFLFALPGFGSSDRVEGGLEAVADRVAEAIRELDLTRQPLLLGNGYGGFVALLVALRHPEIAHRLILADCGAAFSEPGRAAFRGMSAAAKEKGLAAIAEVAMRRLFSPEFQSAHPALIDERRQRFLATDPQTFLNACAALSTLDLRAQLGAIGVPVLVLVGEHDEATPPVMSQELASGLPHAQLQILPGCAHVPQLQDPERFLSAINPFIGA
jgi:3-oxoadipate enol-lactonase